MYRGTVSSIFKVWIDKEWFKWNTRHTELIHYTIDLILNILSINYNTIVMIILSLLDS